MWGALSKVIGPAGEVTVASEPGVGAVLAVTLPPADAPTPT